MASKQDLLFFLSVIAACILSCIFFDIPVARFCSTIDHRISKIFGLVTNFGLSWPYLVATAAAFIYFKFIKKNKALANAFAFLFAAVALSGLVNDLLKLLAGRSRPGLLLSQGIYEVKPLTNQYYYASFPSGHSNTIAAFCYGLTKAFGDFRLILLIAVPAVMASRVILGSHFLSDVIFGAYLGMTVTEIIRRSWVRYFEL